VSHDVLLGSIARSAFSTLEQSRLRFRHGSGLIRRRSGLPFDYDADVLLAKTIFADAEALVLLCSPAIVLRHTVLAQVIHGPGDLMRSGDAGLGNPPPPCHRRAQAPTAQVARRTAGAARWRVCIVRLRRTLPPAMAFWGARPSQELQCLSSGPLRMSGPLSARIVWTMAALMPGTAPSSPPVIRRMWARGWPAGVVLLWACGWRRGGTVSDAGASPYSPPPPYTGPECSGGRGEVVRPPLSRLCHLLESNDVV
jgi:hypothetical protein